MPQILQVFGAVQVASDQLWSWGAAVEGGVDWVGAPGSVAESAGAEGEGSPLGRCISDVARSATPNSNNIQAKRCFFIYSVIKIPLRNGIDIQNNTTIFRQKCQYKAENIVFPYFYVQTGHISLEVTEK